LRSLTRSRRSSQSSGAQPATRENAVDTWVGACCIPPVLHLSLLLARRWLKQLRSRTRLVLASVPASKMTTMKKLMSCTGTGAGTREVLGVNRVMTTTRPDADQGPACSHPRPVAVVTTGLDPGHVPLSSDSGGVCLSLQLLAGPTALATPGLMMRALQHRDPEPEYAPPAGLPLRPETWKTIPTTTTTTTTKDRRGCRSWTVRTARLRQRQR